MASHVVAQITAFRPLCDHPDWLHLYCTTVKNGVFHSSDTHQVYNITHETSEHCCIPGIGLKVWNANCKRHLRRDHASCSIWHFSFNWRRVLCCSTLLPIRCFNQLVCFKFQPIMFLLFFWFILLKKNILTWNPHHNNHFEMFREWEDLWESRNGCPGVGLILI